MKLTNIHGFADIDEYVAYKLAAYGARDKNFETLFELMFDEGDNIMFETTDGYRIRKTTYGAFKKRILSVVPTVASAFSELPLGSTVGLYMQNSPEWLLAFWSILAAGYRVLLLNTRLADDVLNAILTEYSVGGVISDSKTFAVRTLSANELLVPSDALLSPRPFGKEVLFMSSGTSSRVKLSAYTGENFYYQLCDSANIITTCPDIKRHYKGELKQLVLLPLCHVFGFIAVYLWFGFFSRTFVFPRDLDPTTIQRTVKKHKVTHIFAVPMVWEAVAKAAIAKIRARGERTYARFLRVTRLVNTLGGAGDLVARKLLSEVREGLFGDSILFLISGGSDISRSALEFFNGIGYHLANGYGMTEIGITSVEKSSSKRILNSGSIGAPFGYTEYKLDEKGYLLVRGKTRASRILVGGEERLAEEDEWFSTGDMMRLENGRYYSEGRADDLIICEDGENINPKLCEGILAVDGVDRLCIFQKEDKSVALLASIPGVYGKERLSALYRKLLSAITDAKLDRVIRSVLFTNEGLLGAGEFKLSRKKTAYRVREGLIRTFDPSSIGENADELFSRLENEIREAFAETLGKAPEEIGKDSHFFRDLGGTSMDYFVLLGTLRDRLGVEAVSGDTLRLATVSELAAYLQNQ